ncbi:MAG TPA: hypothetical protein VKY19_03475 [Ktedonosporobacter sp.]|jgi:DNA-binding transcriptional ArsR family regulator|nr:hypothetical protein [Ktedonosporobacter sp.]
MPGDADIASVAALLADPARATILFALSDGRAFTASELASRAVRLTEHGREGMTQAFGLRL